MTIYPTADNTPADITIKPIDSNEHPMVNEWMKELHRDKYKKALKEHHRRIEQFKKEFKNKWKPLVGDLMQESGEEETRRKTNKESSGKRTSRNKGRNERPMNENKSEIEGTTYRIKEDKKEITEHEKNLTKIINGTTRQFKEHSKQMKHDSMKVQGEQKTSRMNKTKDHEWKKKKGPIDVSKEIREGMEEMMKQDMYNWSEVLKEDEKRWENKGIYKWHKEHDGKLNHHWVMPDDFYDEPQLEMTRERYIQKYGENSVKEGTLTEEEEKELMDRIRRGEDINGSEEQRRKIADQKNDPEYIKKQMKIFENKLWGITERHDDIQTHSMLPNDTVTTEIDLFKKHGIHLNEFWTEPGFNDNIAVVKENSREMIFCDSDQEDDITVTGNRTEISKQKKRTEKGGTHDRSKENGNCHSMKVKVNGSDRSNSKRNNEHIKKKTVKERTTGRGGFKENKKKKFNFWKKVHQNKTHIIYQKAHHNKTHIYQKDHHNKTHIDIELKSMFPWKKSDKDKLLSES
uniref:Uncharacterized protein n=1 Tax=Cacopsylla melanoneura TaxID=428564 RepID=A0A8D9EZ59_9HEMI